MPLPMAVQTMQAAVAAYQGAGAEPMDMSDDGGEGVRDTNDDQQVFNPTLVKVSFF